LSAEGVLLYANPPGATFKQTDLAEAFIQKSADNGSDSWMDKCYYNQKEHLINRN
jgi:hypothetical protein